MNGFWYFYVSVVFGLFKICTDSGCFGSVMFLCYFAKWSPKGVSAVEWSAFSLCSLNLSRTGRLVSPTYLKSFLFSLQMLQAAKYTMPGVVHLPLRPLSHVWHVFLPDGHWGFDISDRTSLLFNVFLHCQDTRILRFDFFTRELTLAHKGSSM